MQKLIQSINKAKLNSPSGNMEIGELVSQYATMFTLSKKLTIPTVIPKQMKWSMKKLFSNITMPSYNSNGCEKLTDMLRIKYLDFNITMLQNYSIIIEDTLGIKDLNRFRSKGFHNEFQLNSAVKIKADKILQVNDINISFLNDR